MPSTEGSVRVITGPLPPKVSFTTWGRVDETTGGRVYTMAWPELAEAYRAAGERVRAKADLAAPVFALFREQCTPENCKKAADRRATLVGHRCDDAALACTALVYDHDHKDGQPDLTWEAVAAWCKASGIAALFYESPSHMVATDDGVGSRWRVIFPLTADWTEIDAWKRHYTEFRLFLEAQTGIEFDRKTCNPSRVFYPPTRPTEDAAPRLVHWVGGNALDLRATVATLPKAVTPPPSSPGCSSVDASHLSDLDDDDRVAIEKWVAGAFRAAVQAVTTAGRGSRNETLNGETYALIRRFVVNGLLGEQSVVDAMMSAGKANGTPESECRKTIASACYAGKADAISLRELVAKWRSTRNVYHFPKAPPPRASCPPPFDDSPTFDPETGEVLDDAPRPAQAPAPAPAASEPNSFQRLAEVLGDRVNGRFVCPPGFRLVAGKRDEVSLYAERRSKAKAKTCPQCAEACPTSARSCAQGHALPELAPDDVEQTLVARVPLWIEAELVRDAEQGNLLELGSVIDGAVKTLCVPRALIHDARKLAQQTEGAGFALATGRTTAFDFSKYLSEFRHVNRLHLPKYRARSEMGWDLNLASFLLGRDSLGAGDCVLHTETPQIAKIADALRPAGDPAKWLETISQFLVTAPVVGLALSVAVASPMLRPFGWAPIGVMLTGLGGLGKTSVLRAAASVFGDPGMPSIQQGAGIIGNGNATILAVVGQFLSLADLPHLVDELRVHANDPKGRSEIEAALHQLVDGFERARMRRDGRTTAGNRQAPGCAMAASETDSGELLRKGGAIRRYLPVRGPYSIGEPLGRFQVPLAAHYGHAGRALVKALVDCPPAKRAELARSRERCLEVVRRGLTAAESDVESIRTWSAQIAVALASAEVATTLCPEAFPECETWQNQILATWERIKADAGEAAEQVDVPKSAYNATVEWIAAMRAHLHPRRGSPEFRIQEPVIGRIWHAEYEGTDDERIRVVDLIQGRLQDFLSPRGYSPRTFTSEWVKRGWLIPGNRADRHSKTVKIGGTPTECYRVVVPVCADEDEQR